MFVGPRTKVTSRLIWARAHIQRKMKSEMASTHSLWLLLSEVRCLSQNDVVYFGPTRKTRASSYNVDNRKKTIFLPNSSSLFSLSSSLSLSRVCFFAVISICTNRNTGISGGVVDCLNSGALFSGDLVLCFTDCDQFELIC